MTIRWSKFDSFPGNSNSPATTENRPCPVCGSNRRRTVLHFDQFQFYSDSAEVPKRIDIHQVLCLDCLALYMNPGYSEYGLRVLFDEAGCSYGSAVGHTLEQIDWLKTRGLARGGSRLLDAGCYDGSFLSKLPDDVEKIGVDINAPAIARGRQRFGDNSVQFILGDFETFRCERPLDTITMFHVLEHLPRPKAVLQNLRSMVHEGSRLVVEVPILEKGITNDIDGFFSIQHMTHFSRASLLSCLAQTGWRIVEAQEQPDYNGYRVVAAPAEPAQISEKDCGVTALLREYLAGWNLAIKAVEDRVARLRHTKRNVIWGGGAHTEFLYQTTSYFLCAPEREFAIVDSDSTKQGKSWRGIEIHSPEVLRQVPWQDEFLLISSYGSQTAMANAAAAMGVPGNRIVTLYEGLRVY
jgi:SAM-dependent methyltransferase